MGYRHDRDEILAAALELAISESLGALSFGRVAKSIGIPDRTVVYYFPTKSDLVGAVLAALAERLQTLLDSTLDSTLGPEPQPVEVLVARSWPALTSAPADDVMGVYLEAIGLAAAGVEPYASIVPAMVEAWVDWLDARMTAPDGTDRRAAALAALARIDGLLVLRHAAGAVAADAAAAGLGITRP